MGCDERFRSILQYIVESRIRQMGDINDHSELFHPSYIFDAEIRQTVLAVDDPEHVCPIILSRCEVGMTDPVFEIPGQCDHPDAYLIETIEIIQIIIDDRSFFQCQQGVHQAFFGIIEDVLVMIDRSDLIFVFLQLLVVIIDGRPGKVRTLLGQIGEDRKIL